MLVSWTLWLSEVMPVSASDTTERCLHWYPSARSLCDWRCPHQKGKLLFLKVSFFISGGLSILDTRPHPQGPAHRSPRAPLLPLRLGSALCWGLHETSLLQTQVQWSRGSPGAKGEGSSLLTWEAWSLE